MIRQDQATYRYLVNSDELPDELQTLHDYSQLVDNHSVRAWLQVHHFLTQFQFVNECDGWNLDMDEGMDKIIAVGTHLNSMHDLCYVADSTKKVSVDGNKPLTVEETLQTDRRMFTPLLDSCQSELDVTLAVHLQQFSTEEINIDGFAIEQVLDEFATVNSDGGICVVYYKQLKFTRLTLAVEISPADYDTRSGFKASTFVKVTMDWTGRYDFPHLENLPLDQFIQQDFSFLNEFSWDVHSQMETTSGCMFAQMEELFHKQEDFKKGKLLLYNVYPEVINYLFLDESTAMHSSYSLPAVYPPLYLKITQIPREINFYLLWIQWHLSRIILESNPFDYRSIDDPAALKYLQGKMMDNWLMQDASACILN